MLRSLMILIVLGSMVFGFSQTSSPRQPTGRWPAGYWPLEKSQPIIDKTQTITLAPDLSQFSAGERTAVTRLLEVGKIFQSIYEDQRHRQALSSYRELVQLDKRTGSKPETQNLLTLYRLNQGPIATTLENKREPFLPVDPVVPGKNVYPWAVKKEELEKSFAAGKANREEVLDQRSVARRVTSENLRDDMAKLVKHPALDTLHPGLRDRLSHLVAEGLRRGSRAWVGQTDFYAVPRSEEHTSELQSRF